MKKFLLIVVVFVGMGLDILAQCITSGTVTTNTTCGSGITLTGTLTINAGVTLTVPSISISGNNLNINGTLIVTNATGPSFDVNNPVSTITLGSSALVVVGPVGNAASNIVFSLSSNSNLTIPAGATFIVNGKFFNQNTNGVSVSGTLLVNGDLTQNGSPNITVGAGGVIQATGTISGGSINGTSVTTCTSCGFPTNPCTLTSSASPSSVACTGGSTLSASVSGGSGSPTYQWEYTNSSAVGWQTIGGATSSTYSATNINQITDYRCLVTKTGCTAPAYTTVSLVTVTGNVTPAVTIAASPSTSFCSGNTVTFTATASNTGGGTINYNFSKNGISVQSSASNTFATSTLANNDKILCTITITSGTCISSTTAISSQLTMTTATAPTTSVLANGTGATSICAGSSANLKVTITGGTSPFTLVYTGNGGGTVNAYISAANFSVSPASTATFGLTSVTDANGCTSGGLSGTPSITVNTIPSTPTISGTTTYCVGTALSLTGTSATAGCTYAWTPPGTATGLSGAATATISKASITTNEAGTYSIIATKSACPSVAGSVVVVVNPLPSASGAISGTSTVCQSQSGVAYSVAAITNATSYTWAYSVAGATISNTTLSPTIDFSSSAASGNLTVRGTNACGNGTVSANFGITVSTTPANAGAISGTSTVCQGQSGVGYTVGAITNATSYSWTYSGTGATITNGTTNSPTIAFSSTATSGNLTVLGVRGSCNGVVSSNYAITVNPLPSAAGSITGTSPVCIGSSGVGYSVGAITNATSYNWTYSGKGATFTNGTTSTPTLAFSSAGTSGTVSVNGVNACGSGTASTIAHTVNRSYTSASNTNLLAYLNFNGSLTDLSGNANDATLVNAPTPSPDQFGTAAQAYTFNGSNQAAYVSKLLTISTNFTLGIWFKTNTGSGGKLLGIGTAQTGNSGSYDRHIYMTNAGNIIFGCYPGSVKTIQSPLTYNDNVWHQAVATLSTTAGMNLYIDGVLVATDGTVTTASTNAGYIRIGQDNLTSWTSAPASSYFTGSLDEVSYFGRALSSAEIGSLFLEPLTKNAPNCGATLSLTAPNILGATYAWSGPASFASSIYNPSINPVGAANVGTYTNTITNSGCVGTSSSTTFSFAAGSGVSTPASRTNLKTYLAFSGNTTDLSNNSNDGILQGSPTAAADQFGYSNSAYLLNGSSQYVTTTKNVTTGGNVTVGVWFKTNTSSGGKLIGFGSSQTGSSGSYDRHIYMGDNGLIYWGVFTGSTNTIVSSSAYNDNKWHQAVATLSSTNGMKLYLDGALVASNAGITTSTYSNAFTYLRVGYDNLSGWTNVPTSSFFSGTIDEASYYDRELTSTEISSLFVTPITINTPNCGDTLKLVAPQIPNMSYAWSGPSSYTSSIYNPKIPSIGFVNSGTYTVTMSNSGCNSVGSIDFTYNTAGGLNAPAPTSSLQMYLPLNSSILDVSGVGNDGILQNSPTVTTDKFSNASSAYNLNGSNQYITTTKSLSFSSTQSITLGIWFKTNTSNGGKIIGIGTGQTGSSGSYDRHIYMTNTGSLIFGVFNGSTKTVSSSSSYNDNQWHHAVGTFSSTNGLRFYVDGTLVGSDASVTTAATYTSSYVRIGYDNLSGWPSAPTSNFFSGSIDEASFYDRELTAAEIATVFVTPIQKNNPSCGQDLVLTPATISGVSYSWTGPNGFTSNSQVATITAATTTNSGTYTLLLSNSGCTATGTINFSFAGNSGFLSPASTTNLLTYLGFNGSLSDLSGNANNGTLQNAPATTTDAFGNANSAYLLNGSNQNISTAYSIVTGNTLTMGVWFKTNTGSGGKLLGFGTAQTGSSGSYDRHIYMANDGKIVFGVYNGSSNTISSSSSYNDNQWHQAVATFSPTNGMRLYIDGVLVNYNAAVVSSNNSNTGCYLRIGYDNLSGWGSAPTSSFFAGSIDEVSYYNRELTSSEISTMYTTPIGVNSPVCSGGTLNLTAPTITGVTYAWTGPNGFTSSSATPSVSSVSATNEGTYSVTLSKSGCTSNGSVAFAMSSVSNNSISSSQTICTSSTPAQLLGSTPIGTFTSYLWESSTTSASSGFATASGTSNAINYTPAGAFTVNTWFRRKVVGACTSISNVVAITVVTSPVAAGTITGTATVCQSQTGIVYTVPSVTNATGYTWTVPTNATISVGNNTNSITVDYASNASSGNIQVRGTNACGNGTLSPTFAVTLGTTPSAAGVITGTASVCAGTNSVAYSIGAIGGAASYTWTLPTGATIATGSGTNSITVNFSSSAVSGTISVVGVNGSCSGNGSNFSVTVNPTPSAAGSISGSASVCPGTSGYTYTVPSISNALSYTWAYSGTGATISGVGNSVAISFSSSATSGNLTVRGVNSCGNGTVSSNFAIAVTTNPSISITPSSISICSGASATLTANGAFTYSWSPGGLTGASQTLSPVSTTTYTVTGTSASGCTASPGNVTVTVASPNISSAITASVCSGVLFNYTATSTIGGSSFSWTRAAVTGISNGASAASSASISETLINTTSTSVDVIYVFSITANGCTVNKNVTVTVLATPFAAGTITGTSTVCQSQSGVSYSVGSITNATSYTWSYSGSGATITNGTTNAPTIAFSSSATSGNLTVRGVNSCSSGTVSANFAIAVNTTPAAPTAGSNTPLCTSNTLNLSASLVGGTTYYWTGPNSFSSITQNPSISNITSAAGGTYNVQTVISSCSSAVASTVVVVNTSVTPSVSIGASSSSICAGANVIFTATPTNGGSSPSYQWKLNGINAGSNSTTYSNTALANSNTISCVLTSNVTCPSTTTATSNTVTMTVTTTQTWLGGTSTNWFTAANWCGQVPIATSDVIIPTGTTFSPNIGASGAIADSITIQSGATLSMGASGILTLYGNWTKSGTFSAGTGKIVFAGTATQLVKGSSVTDFYHLDIQNTASAGVSLRSAQQLKGTMTLSANAKFNTSGQTFTLINTATDTVARVAAVPATATITGNVTVQRYVPAKRVFRFMGSPVSGATFSQWKNNTHITGPGGVTNNFDASYSNNASCFYYDESLTGFSYRGYTSIANGNNTIQIGKGYRVLIRGDRTIDISLAAPPATNTTLSVTGPLNVGNVSLPVTRSVTPTPYTGYPTFSAIDEDGWNLVANPYASAVDWSSGTGWTKTNMDDAIYYWDPTIGTSGGYVKVVFGIAVPNRANPNIIAPTQGFMVHAYNGSPVLSINESAKTSTQTRGYFREGVRDNLLRLRLSNGTSFDETVLYFDKAATRGFDSKFDAYNLTNSPINLASMLDTTKALSINGLPYSMVNQTIPLTFSSSLSGTFVLSFPEVSETTDPTVYYLKDKFLNKVLALREGASYSFQTTSDPLSKGKKRFELTVIRQESVTGLKDNEVSQAHVNIYPNPSSGQELHIELYGIKGEEAKVDMVDFQGKIVLSKEYVLSDGSFHRIELKSLPSLPVGIYTLSIVTQNGVFKTKWVINP